MRILFDSCCPRPLRENLVGHEVTTAQELGWEALKNGELLQLAEERFDVMISTDSNIEYQQQLPDYEIAVIVLRSLSGQVSELTQLMPDCLKALSVIRQGECLYLFTDVAWEREQKKGKVRRRWAPNE